MKGVPMNRSLLVLALFFFAAPGYSMTATVTSGAQPAAVPTAPGTSGAASSATSLPTIDQRLADILTHQLIGM